MAKRGRNGNDGEGFHAPIDLKVLAGLARVGCTMDEAADCLDVARPTLQRLFNERPELRETWDKAQGKGRMSLRHKQFQLAAAGDKTMLVWLGKNMLGQRDRFPDEVAAPLGNSLAELLTLLRANPEMLRALLHEVEGG